MKTKRVIFKYLSVARAIQVLQSGAIRFSPASAMNDAFELLPALDIQHLKKAFQNFSGDKKSLMGLDDFTLEVTASLLKDYESLGLLCLSERFDVPLMWAHYADNYKGLVIGFDIEEGLLVPHNSSDTQNYCLSGPLHYSKSRAKFPNEQPLYNFFHKDQCWSYEKEWRIVRGLKTLQDLGNGVFVAPFNAKAVRCIIFGALTPSEDKHLVLQTLQQQKYQEVGTYVSFLNDNTFDIDINYHSSTFSDESDLVYTQEELKIRRFRDNLLSAGELLKAMERIDPNTKFVRFKDQVDLYTGKIKGDAEAD